MANWLVAVAVWMLPRPARDRYRHEWLAEIDQADMPAARLSTAGRIVTAAPATAVALRGTSRLVSKARIAASLALVAAYVSLGNSREISEEMLFGASAMLIPSNDEFDD